MTPAQLHRSDQNSESCCDYVALASRLVEDLGTDYLIKSKAKHTKTATPRPALMLAHAAE